jgi:hypothetical protein
VVDGRGQAFEHLRLDPLISSDVCHKLVPSSCIEPTTGPDELTIRRAVTKVERGVTAYYFPD